MNLSSPARDRHGRQAFKSLQRTSIHQCGAIIPFAVGGCHARAAVVVFYTLTELKSGWEVGLALPR